MENLENLVWAAVFAFGGCIFFLIAEDFATAGRGLDDRLTRVEEIIRPRMPKLCSSETASEAVRERCVTLGYPIAPSAPGPIFTAQ